MVMSLKVITNSLDKTLLLKLLKEKTSKVFFNPCRKIYGVTRKRNKSPQNL